MNVVLDSLARQAQRGVTHMRKLKLQLQSEIGGERRMRTLVAFGQDPGLVVKGGALLVPLEVPAEKLMPGPRGARLQVIDVDASTNTLYEPTVIDDDLWQNERDTARLVGDPRFHAQNVYAVVMATVARFELALGRRAPFAFPGGGLYPGAAPGRGHVLKAAPHAFAEANAFYSRRDEGLFFGYFPGASGNVFSCLAHDVVAHETAHALLDGLRTRYADPSSPEQAAFHEAFADIVALLSVFRNRAVVDAAFGATTKTLTPKALTEKELKESALGGLAEQMGTELDPVRRKALRTSVELPVSDKHLQSQEFEEPHRRGEILVAAVMNAFIGVWRRRLGPIGLDAGRALDRERVIEEGSEAAAHLLTMLIRAVDYAPPVDLQFSDYLSAVLTADHQLYPDDRKYRYREALTEWFARFGIRPVAADGAGAGATWERPLRPVSLRRSHHEPMQHDPDEVFEFVWENREPLELFPDAYTYVPSVRLCTRVDVDGYTLRETVAEYVQILDLQARELRALDIEKPERMSPDQPVRLYGGGVLIFDEFSRLKFHIGSGVVSHKQQPRLEYLWRTGFFSEARRGLRRFAHMHRQRARVLGGAANVQEGW